MCVFLFPVIWHFQYTTKLSYKEACFFFISTALARGFGFLIFSDHVQNPDRLVTETLHYTFY